jgi:hypothetical protein
MKKAVMPLNVTTDLESDHIGGLFGCNLDQANVVPNDNGTFLDFWCLRMLLSRSVLRTLTLHC